MLSDSLLTFASYSDDLTKLSVLSLNFHSQCLAQKVCTVLTDDLRSLTVALSRYAEVPRQQDEGEGSSTPALVLPNLSETVPR